MTTSITKKGKGEEQEFTEQNKKKIQIINKYVNRYLTSKLMVLRETQIKTIQKYTTEPLSWGKNEQMWP